MANVVNLGVWSTNKWVQIARVLISLRMLDGTVLLA